MENAEKKQYGMIDVVKFLCALLILLYHYFSEHGPIFWLFDEMLSLYAVAVALFMVMSGFLTYQKLATIQEGKKRWKTVKKQTFRIFKIYLIWSVPYIIYQICRWDFTNINFSFIFWTLQRWIFNSTFYTIWFMPALALGTLLSFWLLEKLPKTLVYILAIVFYAAGALQLTYSFILEALPYGNTFIEFAATWLGGARGWLFFAFPLITFSSVLVRYKDKIKRIPAIIASICGVGMVLVEGLILRCLVGGTGIDLTISMPLAVIGILCFLISINLKSSPQLVWMRKMSVLIFMSQRLFLTVLVSCLPMRVYNIVFFNNYLGALILCGSTIAFCSLIIWSSKKVSWLKNLY